jgi:hypothetical protein
MKRLGLNNRICLQQPFSTFMLNTGEAGVDGVIRGVRTVDRAPTLWGKEVFTGFCAYLLNYVY